MNAYCEELNQLIIWLISRWICKAEACLAWISKWRRSQCLHGGIRSWNFAKSVEISIIVDLISFRCTEVRIDLNHLWKLWVCWTSFVSRDHVSSNHSISKKKYFANSWHHFKASEIFKLNTLIVIFHISSSASRLPKHIRFPNPNGRLLWACGQPSIGWPLIHRSGMYSFGRSKCSSDEEMRIWHVCNITWNILLREWQEKVIF